MTLARLAPCGLWPRGELSCDSCVSVVDGLPLLKGRDAPRTRALLDAAWNYVEQLAFEKTCRQFPGCCCEWIRPCPPCDCSGAGDCRCGAYYQPVDLCDFFGGQPVTELVALRVDGVEVPLGDPPQLRLDECRWLVRQAPNGCPKAWPVQDLARPIGSRCTWELKVKYGTPPPAVVTKAVADMVSEQVKHCIVPDECALPDNLTSVSEGGRTYSFRAPSDTNSGVGSWDEMCRLYGQPEDWKGSEGLHLPPWAGPRIVRTSGRGSVSPQ